MEYVTYDSAGKLTGSYSQDLQPDHEAAHIEVTVEQRQNWTAYQANAARDGLEPAAPVPPAPPTVPESVAMWQARAVMIEDGILDDVTAYLAAMPDDIKRKQAQAKFEYSSTVRRDDPLVLFVIPALGKTEAEIDAMFIRAAVL